MKTPIPIKPCPNCGESEHIWHVHGTVQDIWWMECSKCHWCGREHKLHRKAIRRWNRDSTLHV